MQTTTNPQSKPMTQLEYARAMAERNPNAPAFWMTNGEVLELLEQLAELKQAQPAPMLFTATFAEVTA